MKQVLIQRYLDDIVQGFLKKLVIYGTGRQPNIEDLTAIRRIMQEQTQDGYRLGDLLKALIHSEVFLGEKYQ